MAGELITTDWQMEYRGLLIGDSTNIDLVQIEGLLDLQDVVNSDRTRLRRHGLHAGDDFATGRQVVLTLELWAETQEELDALVNRALLAFTTDDEAPLVFRLPGVAGGSTGRVAARVRRRTAPIDLSYLHRRVVMTVELYATDPRLYSNSEMSLTAQAATPGTGLRWPLTWPLDWGTSGATGALRVVNNGSFTSMPLIRIDGPAPNPYIENRTTNQVFRVQLDVRQGEYLILDSENRTIMLNGRASRYTSLVRGSKWIELVPGENHLFYRTDSVPVSSPGSGGGGGGLTSGFGTAPFGTSPFGSGSTSTPIEETHVPGSTATITWRSAWL